jgi:hypothetical protein
MNRLFITCEEVNALMTAGYTVIRVYTDTSATGDFTTLDGTVTLVASTDSYEYTDVDGTSSTWYKTAYYGAGPSEGSKSSARKGETRAAYATVQELRAELGKTGTSQDLTLARVLDAAARAIDRFCNRPDGFMADVTASARYYPGSGKSWQRIDECAEVTAVAVKDSASDDEDSYTSWTLGTVGSTTEADVFPATGDPAYPDYDRTPYTLLVVGANADHSVFTSGRYSGRRGFSRERTASPRGLPSVKVTAKWGYASTVPSDILEANIMQAARWFKRLEGGMSDTLGSADLGTLLYRQSLDPDIAMILKEGRYVRPAIGRR